ncbi:unnamed protein product [Cuscuta campestris]|uniref:CCHC-type domain-containing protein n=1 Tax=Cuscuta campestris TaxID=132261 RepID=A0A484MQH5_9ASTE|nr:unnamed protein product [Cuscuta campestris]
MLLLHSCWLCCSFEGHASSTTTSLEGLPIHLFDSLALYSIANSIGKPLKTDAATASLSRPSVARICVEVDTSKELPHGVWIHLGQLIFHQPINYEDLPEYCPSCKSFGHKNCKKATKSSRWVLKDTPGTGNTAPAIAVPPLQTVDTTLRLVAKQLDGQNQDGPDENASTAVETNTSAQAETNLFQSDPKLEALATTIVNGRNAKVPKPADSAEDKAVMMVEIEQICVGEDALENNQTPTNTDPNSEIEQSCEAHKLSPKTDLEGTQYEEEFPPLSKESLTTTTDDFPSQKFNSDAHTLSFEKEMDGTLSPTIIGDDETISDPSLRKKIFPPVTNIAGNDQTTTGPILHSFEVDGQHYEIRSYEEAETSNLREEPNDFQDVQNKRNKKAGKRGTAPRTIKTRSYDPNLEVGTVSEITRYWLSRKSTIMEKIVTTKSYSGPFWYVGPVGPIGADGKRPKKIMPRNLALDQHSGETRNLLKMKTLLLEYLRASGQQINFTKSRFYSSKTTSKEQLSHMEKILGMKAGSLPFTYLGGTICRGILRKEHCNNLLEHFDKHISSCQIFQEEGNKVLGKIEATFKEMPSATFTTLDEERLLGSKLQVQAIELEDIETIRESEENYIEDAGLSELGRLEHNTLTIDFHEVSINCHGLRNLGTKTAQHDNRLSTVVSRLSASSEPRSAMLNKLFSYGIKIMAYYACRDKRSGPMRLFRGPVPERTGSSGFTYRGLVYVHGLSELGRLEHNTLTIDFHEVSIYWHGLRNLGTKTAQHDNRLSTVVSRLSASSEPRIMAYFACRDKRSGPMRLFRGPVPEPTGSSGFTYRGLVKEMSHAPEHGEVGPQGEQEHVSVHIEASSFTPQQEVPEPQVPQPNAPPQAVPFLQPQMVANMLQFLQQMAGAYVPPPPPPPPVVVVTIEKLKKNGAEEFRGNQIAEPMVAKRWLERVSRVLETLRVPAEQRGDLAIALLQDAAYDWWKCAGANVPEPVPWATFDELFREEYVPEHFMEEKRDEFMKFTQGELTLPEYRQKFDELAENDINDLYKQALELQAALLKKAEYEQAQKTHPLPPPPPKSSSSSKRPPFVPSSSHTSKKVKSAPVPSSAPTQRSGKGQSQGGYRNPPCNSCGRRHSGECWFTQGLCLGCGQAGHFRRDCPTNPGEAFPTAAAASAPAAQPASSQKSVVASSQRKRPAQSAQSGKAPARTYAMHGRTEQPAHDVIMGIFTLFDTCISAFIDPGSTLSYLCTSMPTASGILREKLESPVVVSNPLGHSLRLNHIYSKCPLVVQGKSFPANLIELPHREFDLILGMDWLTANRAVVDCGAHTVRLEAEDGSEIVVHVSSVQCSFSIKVVLYLKQGGAHSDA